MRFLLILCVLGACNMPPKTADQVDTAEPITSCNGARFEGLIGTSIAAVSWAADEYVRTIGPDTMVTMDYQPERANVMFDDAGIITHVSCG